MKNLFRICIVFMSILTFLSASINEQDKGQKKVINVIEFFDEPPFTLNSKKKEGYLYELLEELFKESDYKLNYISGFKTYDEMLFAIKNNKADILTTFPTSFSEKSKYNIDTFKSVLRTPFVLIGKSDTKPIRDIKELFGKKIAVVKGYAQDKYLDSFPKIQKVYVTNNEEGFEAIRQNKASYYVNNRANTEYVLNKTFSTDLSIAYELPDSFFPTLSLSFAINKDNTELKEFIENSLNEISYKKIKKIKDKWILNSENRSIISLSEEEENWIENNTVRIGIENWAPIIFSNNGKDFDGISADVLKKIIERTNLKVETINLPWAELLEKFKNKEIDLLPTTYYEKQRESLGLYSNVYYQMLDYIYVKDKDKSIKSLEDLNGKTLAVQRNFASIEHIKEKFPKISILETKSTKESIQAVINEEADALFDGQVVVEYEIQKNLILGLKAVSQNAFDSQSLYFFINKDEKILKDIINKALETISVNEINSIKSKWLLEKKPEVEDKKTNENTFYVIVLAFVVFLFLLLILILVTRFISDDFIAKSFGSKSFRIFSLLLITILILISSFLIQLTLTESKNQSLYNTKNDMKAILTFTNIELNEWLNSVDKNKITQNEIKEQIKSILVGKSKYTSKDVYISSNFEKYKKDFNDIKNHQDDLGNKVVSTWIWNEVHDFMLVIKVNDKEALKSFYTLRQNLLTITSLTLLLAIMAVVLLIILGEKATRSIQKANKDLNKLLDSFDENVIASKTDSNGKILYVSKAFCEISGYEKEELINKHQSVVRHEDMPKETFTDLWRTIKKGNVWKGEFKNRKKDASYYWVYAVVKPELDENKKIIGFSAISQDITSKKELEILSDNLEMMVDDRTAKLNESQKRLVTLFDLAPNSIIIVKDAKLVDCNLKTLELFGIESRDKFKTDISFNDLSPKYQENNIKSKSLAHKYLVQAIKDGYSEFEWKHKRYDTNEEFDAQIILSPIKISNETYVYGVITDISEKKKAQKELEESRKNIETILSNIMLPVLISSKESKIVLYANDYASIQYETKISELIGKDINKIYANENEKDELISIVDKLGYVENYEQKYKTYKGKEFTCLVSSKNIVYKGKECHMWMLVDITKQKENEEALREMNKNIHSSIEYASLIQHSLIPENSLFDSYFDDFFAIWEPKDIVGGDIYLFEELRNEDECLLMLIDCTGHGVPGAFVTMFVKAIERQVAAKIASDNNIQVSPAWILEYFNKTMKKLLKQESADSISNAGFEGAIFYYNKKEQIVRFASSVLPLYYFENEQLNIIKGDRHSIGYKKSDANFKFKEHIIDAKDGMKFYLTSDGYIDQNGGEFGFPFGKKRFTEILEKNKNKSFESQKEILLHELEEYQKDEERNDDITVLAMKILNKKDDKDLSDKKWII